MSTNTTPTTPTPKAAPRKRRAKATPPPAPVVPSKDWTYLVDKAPSSLHAALAQMIQDEVGIEIDPKMVQLTLALHHTFQKSDDNKKRAEYRPLHAAVVAARSEHMLLASVESKPIVQADQAKQAAALAEMQRKAAAAAKKAAKPAPRKRAPRKIAAPVEVAPVENSTVTPVAGDEASAA